MTREEFDGFIARLEGISKKHPRLYTMRIIGLVLLAYGYLFLILAGSFVLCLAMIAMVMAAPATIKLAIIGLVAFGGIFLAISRGMWVKLDPPKGELVTRAQAPKLFALLDELRAALDCKPFEKVLIVGDVNAAVMQIPRLGIFGWHRNYLLIGLPLMQILAPDEFKAVLAHEFAHSSRGHGRFGNWIYRVRRTWDQVFQQMARRRSRFGFALFKFVNWFWPVFNGHAFVLARANEYEADECSVRLAGADAAARALTRFRVEGILLSEKFWPDTYARAKQEPEPPNDIVNELSRALKRGASAEDAARWLRQGFLIETNNADTHPCLKDRLRAIGKLPPELSDGKFPETPPPVPEQNAADFFLGEHVVGLARKMSDEWKKHLSAQWKQRHEQAQKLTDELSNLATSDAVPPNAADVWKKAAKLIELHGDAEAVPVLQQILTLEPKHAAANFVLGRHYLSNDDPRGIEHLETAIEADPLMAQNACQLLHAHYSRTGQRDKLRPLENRFDDFQKVDGLARQERARITAKDKFLPHELTVDQLDVVQKVFAAEKDIGRVAIARKQVQHFPQSPCFGVAIEVKVAWWKVRGSAANKKLIQRLATNVKLPGNFIVFVREQNLKPLGKKIFAVAGSVVYRRVR